MCQMSSDPAPRASREEVGNLLRMGTNPLMLLHPFPFDAAFWGPVIDAVADTRTVVTAEAPGFGNAPAREGWQVADWADDVAALIAAQGGRAIVCGLSMGGYAALALVDRHPDTVAGLVLADTRAEADSAEAAAARDAAIARISGGDLAGHIADNMPKMVSPSASDHVRAELTAQSLRQDPAAVCGALRALRDRPDRTAELGRIDVPTLVLVGGDDQITPHAAAQTLHDGIPGARLEVIPDAGHLSAAERPQAFVQLLIGFLDEVDA